MAQIHFLTIVASCVVGVILGAPLNQQEPSKINQTSPQSNQSSGWHQLLLNEGMCGGDMAGGMIPPNCGTANTKKPTGNDEAPAAALMPNANFGLWPYGRVYYEYKAGDAAGENFRYEIV